MKNLNTSNITANVKYPFEKKSIEFLYKSNKEMINALAKSVGAEPDGTSVYVLYGLDKTDLGGGNFSFSSGAIYDSNTDEVYMFDGISSIAISQEAVLTITTTTPSAYNPSRYSNLVDYNSHEDVRVVLSNGALGSSDFNYNDLVFSGWATYQVNSSEMGANVGIWSLGTNAFSLRYVKRGGTVTLNYSASGTNQTVDEVGAFSILLPSQIGTPIMECYGSGWFSNTTSPSFDTSSAKGRMGTLCIALTDGRISITRNHFEKFYCAGTNNLNFRGSVTFPVK